MPGVNEFLILFKNVTKIGGKTRPPATTAFCCAHDERKYPRGYFLVTYGTGRNQIFQQSSQYQPPPFPCLHILLSLQMEHRRYSRTSFEACVSTPSGIPTNLASRGYCGNALRLPTLLLETMNGFEYFFGVRVF